VHQWLLRQTLWLL